MHSESSATGTYQSKLLAARAKFEAAVIDKLDNIDIDSIIENVVQGLYLEVKTISDALLGIDKSWSRPELRSGLIKERIGVSVAAHLDGLLKEKVHKALDKALTSKVIDKKINEAVDQAIEQHMREALNSYNSRGPLRDEVNRRVENMIQEIIK